MCFSESFESLCEGLQNAVWGLGKVPHRHRTDRLSTAVNNMTNPAEFTDRYQALLRYYGIEGEKMQARQAHENGDIEQRHFRFKRAVEQELLLRGSRDFGGVEDYKRFLKMLLERLNAGRRARLAEEMAAMKELAGTADGVIQTGAGQSRFRQPDLCGSQCPTRCRVG